MKMSTCMWCQKSHPEKQMDCPEMEKKWPASIRKRFDLVPYNDFLDARKAQISATKEAATGMDNVIVVDPEDEVVCDRCNDLVETPFLIVAKNGSILLCDKCLEDEK